MSTIKAVDKLREYTAHNQRVSGWMVTLNRIADEIEAEIEERFMELPLDADGVPIRVGDVMVDYKTPRNVVAVAPDSFMMDGYETDSFYRPGLAKNHRHVKRTLEDVLSDFAAEVENDRNTIETARKYADEIRELLGGAE